MPHWLRRHHRKTILSRPFPAHWTALLERNLAHWRHLDDAERQHLRELVQVFVEEKHWEPCGGLELSDEIRVTIAALACVLLLGHDHDLYRGVSTILVYPSTVVAPAHLGAVGRALAIEHPAVPILGQAVHHGPVLLVWDSVKRDAAHPERGHNVVFHEFAHKLDMLDGSVDGSVDGTPPLATPELHRRWVEVCTREFAQLRRRAQAGQRTLLDPYAGTNVGEFFAVATEVFFDTPLALQRKCPELYEVLQNFYRQDPAVREARALS